MSLSTTWESLSSSQQRVVRGGETKWDTLDNTSRENLVAITHALGESLLHETNGLWMVEDGSAEMRPDGREMNVTWKPGALQEFKNAGYHDKSDPLHKGISLKPEGSDVRRLHLVFPKSTSDSESQVHIDYRSLLGGHFGKENDDVVANEKTYEQWYCGTLPQNA